MTYTETPDRKVHEGRNVKHFREMLGIKQDDLAFEKIALYERMLKEKDEMMAMLEKLLCSK